MTSVNALISAFNRGLISRLAMARTDMKRLALSAEEQTNWMPRALGSMMLRPGLGFIDTTRSNAKAKHIPFIFSTDDTAIIEMTPSVMRVRIDDAVLTRVAVSSAVTNGTFNSDVSGWTDADESGAVSAWLTGGYLSLIGTGPNAAIRRQQVTVSVGDQNKEHALRIVIERGPVVFQVGSTSGGQEYIAETELGVGTHSIAFTPTGDFHIQFSNRRLYAALVDSVAVESAGAVELPTPYAEDDLSLMRWDQSGDIVFLACSGHQQRRIERRATRSWSIIKYETEDGPFRASNLSTTTISASDIRGDITLTSNAPLFRSGHVGALFRINSIGQTVVASLSGEDQYTDHIRVTGVGTARVFSFDISGTWAGTVKLQRSVSEPGAWEDVAGIEYNANVTTTYNDNLDNQIIYYRFGIGTGDYTSGTADVTLVRSAGSLTGVARITAVASGTSASAVVLTPLGGTSGSTDWSEGEWSDYRGWPTAVAIYEGRMWWAGKDKIWASVSDAYSSFDDETEGDSGPISRSIGSGPVDTINWLLPLQRLILGAQAAEKSVRSSSFDEPLTPTAFNLKDASTQGSAAVSPVKIDSDGIFVSRAGDRVWQLAWDLGKNDYAPNDLTVAIPELGESGVSHLTAQRSPDTRIHALLEDGSIGILVFDPAEDVKCWVKAETDGIVEDAFVMPNTGEDDVYYVVRRTIDGSTVRYLEKWAKESECRGGTLNKQADSFITFTNSPASATITGLDHLEGESVVVWSDGKCLKDADGEIATFTVSSGSITVTNDGSAYLATTGIVGLPYEAPYKSTKLAYGAQMGTAINQRKRVPRLGLVLADTHAQGLKYGPDFDNLDNLPLVEEGAVVDPDSIHETYDLDMMEVASTWSTDSRICLKAFAPRPATVLSAVVGVEVHEKA